MQGAFYHSSDYAGFWRRIASLALDGFILAIVLKGAGLVSGFLPESVAGTFFSITTFSIVIPYFTLVKRSRFGTAGLALTGLRIVDLNGKTPSLLTMAYRFLAAAVLFWVSPFPGLLDFCWLRGDPHKQTLHDKLAGTYVVRDEAQAAGFGPLEYVVCGLLGYFFIFREVRRAPGQ